MASYDFVEILGGPAVVEEPVSDDLQVVNLIRRGLRRRALDQLAARSELSQPLLAKALDLSIRTLQRYGPEQRLGADATDRLVHLATLYAEGFDTFGEKKFRIWMDSSILALGNRKPSEFIDSISGVRLLRDIIGRINYGVFS